MFTEETVERAWLAARGACRCTDSACEHGGEPCGAKLEWGGREPDEEAPGAWAPHQRISGAGWEFLNCEALCLRCYRARAERGRVLDDLTSLP